MNNKLLAQKVADRVSERLEEQLMEAVQEAVEEIMEEAGLDFDEDETWETMMDIAGRVALVGV